MSASNFRYAAKWGEGMRLAALIGTALISVSATSYAENARPSAGKPGLECDDSMKSADLGDPLAKVALVKLFRAGERVMLAADTPESAPTTKIDLCLVKMMIGPGNDGPPDAPSTSKGIGVEVWLPAKQAWNTRYVGYGQSGYA